MLQTNFNGTFIKMSFAMSLLRITPKKIHAIILYLLMVTVVAAALAQLITGISSCKPVSAFWRLAVDPGAGVCNSTDATRAGIAHSAVALVADVTIGILIPAHLLHRLQMETRIKLLARVILSLGSLYAPHPPILSTTTPLTHLQIVQASPPSSASSISSRETN